MTAPEMRQLFERICREHDITFTYASSDWHAKIQRRHVRVPAPFDDESLAIALHEAGHVVNGECPGTALHFDRRRSSAACLECERRAWATARTWVAFTPRMTARMRSAFRSYRRTTPAPVAAMQAADIALGKVAALAVLTARRKFEAMEARVRAWRSA